MPSEEKVKRALEQLAKSGANRKYFFEKVSSPEWIEPLQKAGLFLHPPSAVRLGDSISFSLWPESRFLVRMAGIASEQVMKVIEKIPATDNVRVHEDFIDAALMMPADLAAKIAVREAKWLDEQQQIYALLPEKVGLLAVHLASGGRAKEALAMLRAVLRLGKPGRFRDIGEAKIDDWHYGQVLQKHLPELVGNIGEPALRLLCSLLDEGTKSRGAEKLFSSAWRHAVEPHEQNRDFGEPEDHLLDAIRDGFDQWLRSDPKRIPETLAWLESKGELFRRLAIHLAAELADADRTSAQARLLDHKNFKDIGVHHEYSRLMRSMWPIAEPGVREELLRWIRQEATTEEGGKEETQKAAERWMLRRLEVLRPHLAGEWLERYQELAKVWGAQEYPDFLAYHTMWVGPVASKTAAELQALSLEDVAKYLRDWEPTASWRSPTREGLARELSQMVRARAAEVAAGLSHFQIPEPTYARTVVDGLTEAAKAGTELPWGAVLEYARWIGQNDRLANFDSKETMDRDPHWGWARKAVARLVEVALDRRVMPAAYLEAVWAVLEPITDDPDPQPKEDVDDAGDVVHRSINATRPVGFHTVIGFTSWLRVLGEADIHGRQRYEDALAKVLLTLDKHLDPEVDPSPAVRSVYGQYLEWLWHLDPSWLRTRIPVIFRESPAELREAAWVGYLTRARLADDVFQMLRGEYSAAVERLKSSGESRSQRDAFRRLAEHLMILVGRATITPEDELVTKFFTIASAPTRAHAIGYVGRALCSERLEVADDFLPRWRALWTWRHGPSAPAVDPLEEAEFGWWFASGRFEEEWSIGQFMAALRRVASIPAEPFVSERLARMAALRPSDAIQILDLMLNVASSDWGLLGLREHGAAILRAGLADPLSRAQAEAVVNKLGAKGYGEFRSLVGDSRAASEKGT